MADDRVIGTDGWCQQSRVRARMAQLKTRLGDGAGPVTDAEIGQWITERFRVMNAIIEKASGVTAASLTADATAKDLLVGINAVGAAIDVCASLTSLASDIEAPAVDTFRREWRDHLRALEADRYKFGAIQSAQESTVQLTASMLSGGDFADPGVKLDTVW